MADSGLTVGIQHPGLPIGMVMSCDQNEFHVHVLDVNANWLYMVYIQFLSLRNFLFWFSLQPAFSKVSRTVIDLWNFPFLPVPKISCRH